MTAVVPLTTAGSAPVTGMAASTWLRPLLDGPQRPLRIVGAGPRAAYADAGHGTVLAIEGPAGARLPNAVGVAALPRLASGARGAIGQGVLHVGPLHARVGRWWDARPRPPRDTAAATVVLRANRHLLPDGDRDHLARDDLTGPVAALTAAAVASDRRALDAVLDRLIGLGPGSTPSGDDVVAGLLATLVVLAPADGPTDMWTAALAAGATARGGRTTALSATLLRCAADGAVASAAGRVLRLLASPPDAGCGLPPAVADLARLGHTSGRDLLAGIAIGVDALIADRSHA